jgi:hypothetical protein
LHRVSETDPDNTTIVFDSTRETDRFEYALTSTVSVSPDHKLLAFVGVVSVDADGNESTAVAVRRIDDNSDIEIELAGACQCEHLCTLHNVHRQRCARHCWLHIRLARVVSRVRQRGRCKSDLRVPMLSPHKQARDRRRLTQRVCRQGVCVCVHSGCVHVRGVQACDAALRGE